MTPNDEGKKKLEAAFIALFESGDADKILNRLRAKFSGLPRDDVTEMFQEACTEVVRRHEAGLDTGNVAGLITTIARNKLVDVVRGRDHEEVANANTVLLDGGWRHDEERQAAIERATKYLHDIVESWDLDNHRRIMLLMLDAASDGLFLQPKEMDEELNWKRGTSSVLKVRAMDRLRKQLADDGVLTWDELLDLLPIETDIEDHDTEHDEEYIND